MAATQGQTRHIIIRSETQGAKELNALARQMGALNSATKGLTGVVRTFGNAFQTVFAASLFGVGIGQLTNMMDTMQQLRDRIGILVGDTEKVNYVMDQLAIRAQRTKVPMEDMANSFARISQATKAAGLSTESMLSITEALQQTFRISGSTSQEAAAATVQLTQGLAAGTLRGEEFNSVMEQNVVLGNLLAEGFNTTTGGLRAMARAGEITNTKVLQILAKNFQTIDGQANKLNTTIGQAMSLAFTKVSIAIDKLNTKFGASSTIVSGIETITENMGTIVKIMTIMATLAIPKLISMLGKLRTAFWSLAGSNPMLFALTAISTLLVAVYDDIDKLEIRVKNFRSTMNMFAANMLEITDGARFAILDAAGANTTKLRAESEKQIRAFRSKSFELSREAYDMEAKLAGQNKTAAELQLDLEKDLLNMKTTALKTDEKKNEMLAALNREYAAGKITAEQYYRQFENTNIRMANKDFMDGKKSLSQFNEEQRESKRIALNAEFRSGTLTLEQYKSAMAGVEASGLWDKLQSGKINVQEYNAELAKLPGQMSTIDAMALGVNNYIDSMGTYAMAVAGATTNVLKSLEDDFVNFAKTGEMTFESFTNTIMDQLLRITYQMMIMKPLVDSVMGYFSSPSATAIGGNGGTSGQYLTPNAKGNAFGPSGITAFAKGGVVSSPTMFGFGRGKAGLMGEAGPEAIMPLRRTSSGDLGVQATTSPVYVNITNNTSSEVSATESTGPNGERVIEVLVNTIVKRGMGNGTYDTALQQNYNVRRKGQG